MMEKKVSISLAGYISSVGLNGHRAILWWSVFCSPLLPQPIRYCQLRQGFVSVTLPLLISHIVSCRQKNTSGPIGPMMSIQHSSCLLGDSKKELAGWLAPLGLLLLPMPPRIDYLHDERASSEQKTEYLKPRFHQGTPFLAVSPSTPGKRRGHRSHLDDQMSSRTNIPQSSVLVYMC